MNRKPLRELLEGSVQGKEDAFEELYQHYRAYIVHTAQSLIGKYRSLHQADEVVQEIWKDLWESKLEKFQGEADKAFLGWLYRVVQNHLLDQIRRAKRQPEVAAPEEVDELRSMQAWWQAQSAELQEEKIERGRRGYDTTGRRASPDRSAAAPLLLGRAVPWKPLPPRSWRFLERN